jgi:hypothetical protein
MMNARGNFPKAKFYGFGLSTILVLFFSIAWAEETHLIRVSRDPYTDPLAHHATEVDPSMVTHGETIVTAFQVGRFQGTGADNIGWATSKDGGRTWKNGFLSGLTLFTGGTWPSISIPVVAFDHKHSVYIIAMMPFDDQGNGRGILVSRSSDGLTWSQPILAASSDGANGHWFSCDDSADSPYYGNCYDAFFDYSSPIGNFDLLVTSVDGGLTWTGPVTSPDQSANLVTSMAIQPNGNLVVLGRNGGSNFDQIYAIPSTDGGHTLGPTTDIATSQFIFPYMRADPSAASAVDAGGTIYVVFPDCRFRPGCLTNDMVLTTSKDGIIWSALQRVPIDPVTSSVDHLIAGLATLSDFDHEERHSKDNENHTRLALTYYYLPNGATCVPTTCQIDAGFISTDNGGHSWHEAAKIAGPMAQSWLVPTYAGAMVADFGAVAFVDGRPFGTFAIAKPPNAKTGQFDEAIYVARLPDERD